MQRHLGTYPALIAAFVLATGCAPKAEAPPTLFDKVLKEDIKVGTGVEPVDGDLVYLEYTGTLAKNGVEFETNNPEFSDKSKVPLVFYVGPTSGVIPGMLEGVRGMKVGGERKVSVPWKSAYAEAERPGIPAYSDLVFNLKLLYVVKKGDENSVEVKDLAPGSGPALKPGDIAEVHYKGTYVNNWLFDSTYERKKTVSFKVGAGEAVSGFDKGIEGMKVGGKRRITLAPEAGWGSYGYGVIPANAVLVYEVDLVSIKAS